MLLVVHVLEVLILVASAVAFVLLVLHGVLFPDE